MGVYDKWSRVGSRGATASGGLGQLDPQNKKKTPPRQPNPGSAPAKLHFSPTEGRLRHQFALLFNSLTVFWEA